MITELGGFEEESIEQKLPDLGRCLLGYGFNDGENTMKGDPASLSRMKFPCDEGVDGAGDLRHIDCMALCTKVGELTVVLSLCLRGTALRPLIGLSLPL
jgi:hypothetical protein